MITLDELLAELERLGVTQADAELQTVLELQDAWGKNDYFVRDKLRQAKRHGMLVVGKKPSESINGHVRMVDAYKISLPEPTVKCAKPRKRRK